MAFTVVALAQLLPARSGGAYCNNGILISIPITEAAPVLPPGAFWGSTVGNLWIKMWIEIRYLGAIFPLQSATHFEKLALGSSAVHLSAGIPNVETVKSAARAQPGSQGRLRPGPVLELSASVAPSRVTQDEGGKRRSHSGIHRPRAAGESMRSLIEAV